MDNAEAIAKCEQYGREIMGLDNVQGKMLEILTAMTNARNSRLDLPDEYIVPYNVAMAGFRRLFAPA